MGGDLILLDLSPESPTHPPSPHVQRLHDQILELSETPGAEPPLHATTAFKLVGRAQNVPLDFTQNGKAISVPLLCAGFYASHTPICTVHTPKERQVCVALSGFQTVSLRITESVTPESQSLKL